MVQAAQAAAAPPPFSVIGGFLGAGKTTLLNRLLAEPRAPRCAVLVNDFGDIAVDAALIDARGGETIAMQNGCICCSIGGDLARAIAAALDLQPAHIVVEASGVAHPGRIAAVARVSPELRPGRVFVLADAGALRAQLNDAWIADTVAAQLRAADHILVSKLDAQPPREQAAVIDQLAREHPAAALSTTDEVQWADLLAAVDASADADADADAAPADVDSDSPDTPAAATAPATATNVAAPHARFVARTLRADAPIDLRRLAAYLKSHPDIYRLKGWAIDPADGKLKLLQAAGPRLAITPYPAGNTVAATATTGDGVGGGDGDGGGGGDGDGGGVGGDSVGDGDTAPPVITTGILAILIGNQNLPPAAQILRALTPD
ncbi:MAG: GTP-binding protein [Gammaproteobacteria bacterium]|nr:GTP-binding protein [Gammaproteobacteria bacterium]